MSLVPTTFASLHGGMANWGLIDWIIVVIALAGAIAVAWVVLDYLGLKIPPVFIKIFWIVLLVIVAIVAVHFIVSVM